MTISDLAAAGGAPFDRSGLLLADGRASLEREEREQAARLAIAVEYAALNPPTCDRPAAVMAGTEGALLLGGEGVPPVAEFAVVELAAAWGMSLDSGRRYLGQALELRHRLPLVWRAVQAGRVAAWRGRRIAERTMCLPAEGAAWVDAQVFAVAGRVGVVVLERLVEEAIVRFDPETAAARALEALETRHVSVALEQALSEHGAGALATGRVEAVLDAADALDLDAALADLASDLARAGDTDPLDVRRARAMGLLARGESVDLPEGVVPRRRREIVLHVHLTDAALRGSGDGIAQVRSRTGHPLGLVTVDQVREWCGSSQVTVKPVIDLAELLVSTGYRPSDRLRDQVVAINPTCVFPHCDRAADDLDLDHIREHASGGPTDSRNLAPLCRRHHRAKTFDAWHYVRLGPGEYLWTSPHGYQWIKDQDGTRDVSGSLRDTG